LFLTRIIPVLKEKGHQKLFDQIFWFKEENQKVCIALEIIKKLN